MPEQESHEDFMKRCFGDDFWDKSEAERFEMAIKRCLATPPSKKRKGKTREATQIPPARTS